MSAAISPRLYADLVGKPFELGARGPDTFDCVGLSIEFHRRRGFVLPEFLTDVESLHRAVAAGGPLEELKRLEAPVSGCAVLMRSENGVGKRHIGSMVSPYKMLHTCEDTGAAVIESLSRSLWARRILGFYAVEGR